MPLPYHAGKAFLAKTISNIIHEKVKENPTIKNYAEPFSGMQRVGIQVMVDDKNKVFKKYYFSDVIPRISVFFKALHKGWLPNTKSITQEKWEKYKRNDKNTAQKTFVGYTLGFAGQYFGGSKPAANKPPDANTQDWTSLVLKRKKEYIKSLQPYFKSSKYVYKEKSVFDMDYKNTIIYCDPPYVATAFRAKKIWDKEKEKKLWNTIKKWLEPSKNNIVILSNSKRTAKVRGLRIKKIYEDDVDYGSWKENYKKRKEMIFEVVSSSGRKTRKKKTRKKRGGEGEVKKGSLWINKNAQHANTISVYQVLNIKDNNIMFLSISSHRVNTLSEEEFLQQYKLFNDNPGGDEVPRKMGGGKRRRKTRKK